MNRGIGLLALLAAAGCQSVRPDVVRIDSTAGMYQTAKLTYRIDAGQLSEPVKVANISGQQVSYQQKSSGPYADRSIARLALQYPHPDGRHPGYALAEVVIEARKPPGAAPPSPKPAWRRWADEAKGLLTHNGLPGVKLGDGVKEAWKLEIPRADLDDLIGRLSQTGYFHLAGNPKPGVILACRIDGQQTDKQWGHVPELDALIERVRQQGALVSYEGSLDDEPLAPRRPKPVQLAAPSWPPAGPAPGNAPRQVPDWVANQAGVPIASPRPAAARPYGPPPGPFPSPSGQYPQTARYSPPLQSSPPQQPYPTTGSSQGGAGPSVAPPQSGPTPLPAVSGGSGSAPPPAVAQPFPTTASRAPLGDAPISYPSTSDSNPLGAQGGAAPWAAPEGAPSKQAAPSKPGRWSRLGGKARSFTTW